MRAINAWLYTTVDGVMEAPENWVMPDEEMFADQTAGYDASDGLLIGHRTYEVFASSWPQRGSDVDNADWMNNTNKYVVSSTIRSPEWQNTTVLAGDVQRAVSRLKHEDGQDITINGSSALVRSLLTWGLLDELRLYQHPVVLGSGARLFGSMDSPVALELSDFSTYDNGVVSLTYIPQQRQ